MNIMTRITLVKHYSYLSNKQGEHWKNKEDGKKEFIDSTFLTRSLLQT